MDYEVFIVARMREEYDRLGSTSGAVVSGLARTGRLVTCAALILAISFLSLTTQPDIVVRMIATGLAAGIIIDAVLVRTLLVPALVAIFGRWNWWMPDRPSVGCRSSMRGRRSRAAPAGSGSRHSVLGPKRHALTMLDVRRQATEEMLPAAFDEFGRDPLMLQA
jgi:uncharacterized membrane protein YdfJ with MMPL/SSD domain